MKKTVVIAGSGFGGIDAALNLRKNNKNINIVVIDQSPFFTYQISLHEIISGKVKPKNIRIDLAKLYKKKNIQFFKEEIVRVDPLEKSIITRSRKVNFDYLVVGVGSVTNYMGVPSAKEHSFDIKNLNSAVQIKKRVLNDLKKAEHYNKPLNLVVCGGGLTGVEVAAELADLSKGKTNVILIESSPNIMKGFKKEAIQYTEKVLKKKGINIKKNVFVKKAEKDKVVLSNGETIYSNTFIWCCGVKPNPVTYKLGLRTNEKGALMVNEFLQTGFKQIYAFGDCSYMYKKPQPATALMAIQQGRVIANNIIADINGEKKEVFTVEDWPYLIALGKRRAIMIRHNRIKKGLLPAIIKKFIEKQYLLTKKYW